MMCVLCSVVLPVFERLTQCTVGNDDVTCALRDVFTMLTVNQWEESAL